ncbi:MAG TPA: tetratricopeptide repeat protein [Candidatus Dormibacteraeota bacterium]|nr:tetratricopeptide repeat protein [Candidatus Dormibacteraeota bacterium]
MVVSETATTLVVEGRTALSEGTLESNERAAALFERAIDADPGLAPAYVGLATAYLERAADLRLGRQWLEHAIAAGEKAIQLDPSSAEGYLALGLTYRSKGLLQKELQLWQRRMQFDPSDSIARTREGWVLWFTGRPDEALPRLHAAAALQPADRWVHFFLGNANLALGNYPEAERMYLKQLGLHPDHSSAQAGVIWSLLAADRDEAARTQLRRFQTESYDTDRYPLKLADIEYFLREDEKASLHAREALAELDERYWPRGFLASTILGALLWRSDREGAQAQLASSERIDRERLEGGDEGYMPHIDLAAVEAIRGEARAACRSLRAAMAAGWWYPALAARDRLFASLHTDNEFRSLVVG